LTETKHVLSILKNNISKSEDNLKLNSSEKENSRLRKTIYDQDVIIQKLNIHSSLAKSYRSNDDRIGANNS